MGDLEVAVLELLIFPEGFESIVDECRINVSRHVLGDVLKRLLHDEYVAPFLKDADGNFIRSLGYDSDFLNDYFYQATAKGVAYLEDAIKSP